MIGSVIYLAVIFGVMIWRGISIEPEWVVLALLVIAIAMGRGLTFIADWGPFLLLFFAYEAMRGFAAKTGFAPHDLSGFEQAVFAGTLPTLTLQHAFYHVESVSPQDVLAMFFYFMHFPLPILVGFVFWLRSREHYHRFIAALLLMALLAFVTYLFWPSAPPWYQFQEGAVPSSQVVHKILNAELITVGPGSLYTSILPNLLVEGMVEAIKASPALKLYICNLAAQAGETDGYGVDDYLRVIREHVGANLFDFVLVNSNTAHVPTGGQSQVIFRPVDTSRHPEVRFIASDVVNVKIPSHHDPDKLARTIMRKVWQA